MSLCPLCSRPLGDVNVDQHHLVPKSRRGREKSPIHKICHRKIHATFTEKELERKYHTWEALREHEVMKVFITWVQSKDPSYYSGSSETSTRRRR